MECQTCKSVNDASSRFCKECGSKLTAAAAPPSATEETVARAKAPEMPPVSPEVAEKRKARVAELLPRAFAFAEKGAMAEAIATAEEAAGLVPTSTAAHALLANLYEKSGQMARAVESMKKVVALTPDGTEEKERLDSLQREAARRAAAPPEKDEEDKSSSPVAYWVPRIGAALAGALVVGIGLSLLMRPTEPLPTNKRRNTPTMAVGERPGTAFASVSPVQEPVVQHQVFIPAPSGTDVDPFSSKGFAPTPAPRQRESSSSSLRRLSRQPTLPSPDREQEQAPPLVPPVIPALPVPSGNGAALGGIQAAPPAERIPVGPPATRQEKAADEGFIRIESHPANSGNNSEKSEKTPDKPEVGDPAQQARAFQGAGRYRDAVGRYQVALAASEAPAELHQNLGLCYQRLGEVGAARDAYSRAIDAYQAQVQRGREIESARRGIASCQAALEILRG